MKKEKKPKRNDFTFNSQIGILWQSLIMILLFIKKFNRICPSMSMGLYYMCNINKIESSENRAPTKARKQNVQNERWIRAHKTKRYTYVCIVQIYNTEKLLSNAIRKVLYVNRKWDRSMFPFFHSLIGETNWFHTYRLMWKCLNSILSGAVWCVHWDCLCFNDFHYLIYIFIMNSIMPIAPAYK